MEPNPENGKSTNEGGNKRTVLIVIIILLLANAFLLWQFFSKKSENATLTQENIEVNADKDSISAEYETVKVELNKLQADNTSLQGKLSENDAAIVKQKEKIDKLMRENASLPTLRSEVKKLKDMKSQYEVRIAELETQNLQLTSENKDLNTNLTGEKTKNESLSKENQGLSNKVALGSILRAEEIVAKGVRFKSSGKEIEENKSKNVQKIRTCFTIRENVVVDKGQKDIFLRIMGPDKSVLSTSSATFKYNGQLLPFTQKQEINYANKKIDQCVYWEKGSAFVKGKYAVEIYADGNQIGIGEFELK